MKRSLTLSLSAPLVFMLAACAPEHATVSPVKTQAAAAAVNTCRIPDDHISQRRYPWFVARDIMYHAIEQFIQQAQGGQST
ncbi:hypothetical protein [Enterobacter hormaechei]|uniref:hypothetical protein n=1 Tax=Enterobacter hormaechei TaxID=158836 RepID=UPI0018D1858D|nr:hypothetical protein [Enterobacter hormaechei]QPO53572.1 hypothetical protein GVI75_16540 [Enterobacter hormaechei]